MQSLLEKNQKLFENLPFEYKKDYLLRKEFDVEGVTNSEDLKQYIESAFEEEGEYFFLPNFQHDEINWSGDSLFYDFIDNYAMEDCIRSFEIFKKEDKNFYDIIVIAMANTIKESFKYMPYSLKDDMPNYLVSLMVEVHCSIADYFIDYGVISEYLKYDDVTAFYSKVMSYLGFSEEDISEAIPGIDYIEPETLYYFNSNIEEHGFDLDKTYELLENKLKEEV